MLLAKGWGQLFPNLLRQLPTSRWLQIWLQTRAIRAENAPQKISEGAFSLVAGTGFEPVTSGLWVAHMMSHLCGAGPPGLGSSALAARFVSTLPARTCPSWSQVWSQERWGSGVLDGLQPMRRTASDLRRNT